MNHRWVLSAVLSLSAAAAWAAEPQGKTAEPKTNFIDHSAAQLIDAESAKKVMSESIPARVWKLYPPKRYAFVSQVEGGIGDAATCVIAARVMMVPVTQAVKAPLFRPIKTSTAYGSWPNAGYDQCKSLARDKLKEATQSVVSALVKV